METNNEENKIGHKIEIFGVSIIMALLFLFLFNHGKKVWSELSIEKRKQIKKAIINDFKLACILTIFVIIVLIFTDHFY